MGRILALECESCMYGQMIDQNTCFGGLSNIVQQMMAFGMAKLDIRRFVLARFKEELIKGAFQLANGDGETALSIEGGGHAVAMQRGMQDHSWETMSRDPPPSACIAPRNSVSFSTRAAGSDWRACRPWAARPAGADGGGGQESQTKAAGFRGAVTRAQDGLGAAEGAEL